MPSPPHLTFLMEINDVSLSPSLKASHSCDSGVIVIVAPQGKIGVIDDRQTLDLTTLVPKTASFDWELIFVRSTPEAADTLAQLRERRWRT